MANLASVLPPEHQKREARKKVTSDRARSKGLAGETVADSVYQRLNKPINAAFATVLKLRLNPTTAADVSDVTGSVSCETANIVKM